MLPLWDGVATYNTLEVAGTPWGCRFYHELRGCNIRVAVSSECELVVAKHVSFASRIDKTILLFYFVP